MKWRSIAWLALACAGACGAQVQRLDDSASPRSRVPAQLVLGDNGRPLAATPWPETAQIRFGRIDYRLATAAFVGHRARISYVVPPLIPGLRSPQGLRVQWRGLPPLASGSGRPGERVAVWSGVVTESLMSVSLELEAQLDLAQLELRSSEPFGFECYFDIEVLR